MTEISTIFDETLPENVAQSCGTSVGGKKCHPEMYETTNGTHESIPGSDDESSYDSTDSDFLDYA